MITYSYQLLRFMLDLPVIMCYVTPTSTLVMCYASFNSANTSSVIVTSSLIMCYTSFTSANTCNLVLLVSAMSYLGFTSNSIIYYASFIGTAILLFINFTSKASCIWLALLTLLLNVMLVMC